MWSPSVHDTTRLLTRHFFRRFIENDLISPDADRHQTLAVVCAGIVSFGLVVTLLLALKYVGPLSIPGQVSLNSLDDKFLYIGWSMAMMALVTLAEWDALALDWRDASILGPLPIGSRAIFHAKATALLLFVGGCAVILNLVPSILFPSAMVSNIAVDLVPYLTLVAVHAMTTMAAGAFGFLSVLGLRELLHACLGTALFRRVSTVLQASLVVFFVTALCLLPGLSYRIGRDRMADGRTAYAMPPLWFLGLYEAGAGHVIDGLPRGRVPKRLVPFEKEATDIYRSRTPEFGTLAETAVASLGLVGLIATAAYSWNNRRLPSPVTDRQDRPHRLRRLAVLLAERGVVRHPLTRAGFFFTVHTLWRSGTHRLTMAVAVALALALTTVALQGVEVRHLAESSRAMTSVLAIQPMVILVLFAGFRHAARVPAQLRANWAFQLSWSGEARPYMAGVKRAALLAVACPALLMLFPIHVALLGSGSAVLHLLCGLFIAIASLDVVMLGFRTLPFASSYVGGGNLKAWLPLCVLGFWPVTRMLATLERVATGDASTTIALLAGLAAVSAGIRMYARSQRESYGPVEFYELPVETQRLDLSA
jgi:hypothetical protein